VEEPEEELLTAEDAAARLNVTRSYLYRLIKRGVLPEAIGIRNGREVKLIPARALERLDAHEGLLVRDVGAGAQRPVTDASVTDPEPQPSEPSRARPEASDYALLVSELRAELRALREQLAQERAARQELEGRLATREPAEATVAAVVSRANEVTALVKASEVRQNRILEELLAQRRWGRAKQIAYAVYLVVTTAASIGAIIFVFQMAAHLRALLAR